MWFTFTSGPLHSIAFNSVILFKERKAIKPKRSHKIWNAITQILFLLLLVTWEKCYALKSKTCCNIGWSLQFKTVWRVFHFFGGVGVHWLQPLTHAFTSMGNLELPVDLSCMYFDCGRKPKYPDETHTSTERMCKLHTDRRPQSTQRPNLVPSVVRWQC